MGYEAEQGRARAQRVETFGVYVLFGGADRLAAGDDVEGFITEVLARSDAPAPNEVLVHRMPVPESETESTNWLDDLIATLPPEPTTPTAPPPDPPSALVFHQESGSMISRYITIVLT